MGTTVAKAFLPLAGTPMLVYSLRTLSAVRGVTSMTLVVGADHLDVATSVIHQHAPWPLTIRVTQGGAERQDSVAAGLSLVDPGADVVLVHDAARPFVSPACVQACIDAAAATGAAIVALPARDTVKVVDQQATIRQTVDRRTIWLAQTPQVFRAPLLRQAYQQARRDRYVGTDDAELVERIGGTVSVVPGDSSNRKITTPDDLRWAEWYVRTRGSTASEDLS